MKTIPLIVILLLLLGLAPATALAQGSTSNKGTEFWTAWMDHVDGTTSAMSLYITGDVIANVKVECADGSFSKTYTVTPNQVTIVQATDIPISAYLDKEGYYNKGIHITSDKNIVVYAHIYHNNRSAATLVLPVNAMGKDYYSINYTQIGNANSVGYSTFCVIATEDNTSVEVTPTQLLSSGQAANVPFTLTLKKGQLYQALSTKDLTGTHIKSISSGTEPCKKIAVYSGSSFIGISCGATPASGDNLFQQAYPTATWGKNFVTAPLAERNYDVFRIIYSDPSANVTLNGVAVTATQSNSNFAFYEFKSQTANIITSNKPIQVVQYAVTQNTTVNCTVLTGNAATDVGDPEMIFLTPIEQGLDHVTLYSTSNQNITKSFINVIIPTSATASFLVDGKPSNFTSIPNSINNTSYSYTQIKVNPGTHNISASTPFNAIAYGFGNVESYGYSAGTDLKNLNEFIELKDPTTNTTASSGCVNVTYKPQISIPYQTQKISWDFKDGTPPVVDNTPVLKGTTVKGTQTLYIYEYNSVVTYTQSGSYSIVATVLNPTADDCGSDEQIEFDYSISDIPATTFTASSLNTCPATEISFTDKTDTKGVNTKTWLWDFGDGSPVTAENGKQNPKHTYTTPGDYKVTLTIVNENGCSNTSPVQTVHVNKPPVAAFTASTPDCETRIIAFTDNSTSPETAITPEVKNTTWAWDFGDVNADPDNPNTATTQNPQHIFKMPGVYTVTLTVTSNTGCSNTITNTVTIHALPVVDFILPDACLNDSPQFTNKTIISDNSELTYAWDFGDPNATGANKTSTLANPSHHYIEARDDTNPYIITLTVTSKYDCSVTITKKFTVNGASPTADFDIPASPYCSSDDVKLINKAAVSFGKITLMKVYWDYNGDQTNFTTYQKDEIAAPGFQPTHKYPLLTTLGQTQNYGIKMIAYSGSALSCSGESAIKTVTIKANPTVTLSDINVFSTINTFCQESTPVKITENTNGFTGIGTFSGPGISSTGLFDPAKSGPGTFTINYVFQASNGCDFSTTKQITVYPTPKVDAGGDLHLLQGGTITINATASGVQPLKYKWTMMDGSPAVGLDHDDVLTPIASPIDDVTYMLTVTSSEGCTASSKMSVAVLKAPIVPNTFTPNHDGTNDTWEIKYLDTYPNCSIDVYNRYGEKLYSSIGYPIAWDGTYKGTDLPVGTYYYIINPKNGRKVITGSITIIR